MPAVLRGVWLSGRVGGGAVAVGGRRVRIWGRGMGWREAGSDGNRQHAWDHLLVVVIPGGVWVI